jgi:Fe-S oxidoreductase/nitrate reductase gamma subunit
MSHDTALLTESKAESRVSPPRLTAAGVLSVVAVLAVAGTLVLGWLGTLPGEHDVEVGRQVFGNIPDWLQAVFYVATATFLGLAFYLFSLRAASWRQGGSDPRIGKWGERGKALDRGLRMKTLMSDRVAGLMHSLIYYGFLILFAGTVTLEIDHLLPVGLKFLDGVVYQAYSLILDLAGIAFLAGLAWAGYRRYVQRPWRLRSKTKPEDGWILLTLASIGVSGLLTEAARIAMGGRPAFERWSIVGYTASSLVPATWHQALWVLHVCAFLAFLVVLPTTKLRHLVTSPANMFLSPKDRPKGAMRAMPNLLEVEEVERIGVSVVSDLTWKQIFDTDACTVCGRCTSVCPANLTGKPLDPREIVLKTGEVAAVAAGVSPPVGLADGVIIEGESILQRVRPEEVWACTTCRACDEICPVNIEILDRILDIRRYLTLMESEFPSELSKAFVAMENQGNPWGLAQAQRGSWTEKLDFPVKVLGAPGVDRAEYLWFVGCAGSYDERNQAVAIALAKLMHKAGIDFAILGPRETCTGDPARRSGNEYLFQQLATANIATFSRLSVEKVITQCPHCFNTLVNEYPQLGGNYEVIHHSQLLAELIREGRLSEPAGEGKITYHDPCYLGRHNDVYMAPREVVAGRGELVEMPRHGTRSFCCGAGGARFWMEEHTGKKVQTERTEEAIATGATEIAVACPFCYVMIDDAVKELGREGDVRVRDLAVILAEGQT